MSLDKADAGGVWVFIKQLSETLLCRQFDVKG